METTREVARPRKHSLHGLERRSSRDNSVSTCQKSLTAFVCQLELPVEVQFGGYSATIPSSNLADWGSVVYPSLFGGGHTATSGT